jgi:hypothetical protein
VHTIGSKDKHMEQIEITGNEKVQKIEIVKEAL